jgi:hypothetical protein
LYISIIRQWLWISGIRAVLQPQDNHMEKENWDIIAIPSIL